MTSSRCSRIATSPGRATRVEQWVSGYREMLARARRARPVRDEREFLRWFDMIGVQRHIKVLGIFARLWYRDGKAGYLQDLPLTLEYVRDTCTRYRGARRALALDRTSGSCPSCLARAQVAA